MMNPGALLIGLFAVAAGLPSVVWPQAVLDFTCRVSPLCESPTQLSPTGRTYNRIIGGGLAFVGVLLIGGYFLGI
jgi:hypothetical protein